MTDVQIDYVTVQFAHSQLATMLQVLRDQADLALGSRSNDTGIENPGNRPELRVETESAVHLLLDRVEETRAATQVAIDRLGAVVVEFPNLDVHLGDDG